jgi:hypothetical protein
MRLIQVVLLAATAGLLLGAAGANVAAWRLRRKLRRLGHRGGRFQAPGWALLLVGVNATLALLWLVLLLRVTLIAP